MGQCPSIAVQHPSPTLPKGFSRSNKVIHSDHAWKELDEKRNVLCYERYYTPKIILPITVCNLRKPLTKSTQEAMEVDSERLLLQFQPARYTSAQYMDQNGEPLLFYFGRRLVCPGDRKVSYEFMNHIVFASF
jgi:hypothetical protein